MAIFPHDSISLNAKAMCRCIARHRTRLTAIALLVALATLGTACDRHEQQHPIDSATHIDRLRRVSDNDAKRATPDSSVKRDSSAIANVVDSVPLSLDTLTSRPPRFSIVDHEPGAGPCLAIAKDSLPLTPGTEVILVNIGSEYDEKRSAQHLAKGILLGPVDSTCGRPGAFEEPAYRLRVTTGEAADGFGIVGPVASLKIEHHRAVAKFPGDTAQWRFWTCTSNEGVHYEVGRRSADSLIVLWDGYYHLDYDTEPDCESERSRPRANEARLLLAAWDAGKRDRETGMRLLLARWSRCGGRMGGDVADSPDTSAVVDSSAYPGTLPPMDELHEAIAAKALSAEDAFVVSRLAEVWPECMGESLWKPAGELLAEAVRQEPASALFKYFQQPQRAGHGSVLDVAAEVHRRFGNRGEHYRMFAEWLEAGLPH